MGSPRSAERDHGTVHPDAIPYKPPRPRKYIPRIALVGCGNVAPRHLAACRELGFPVTALCDVNQNKAERLRDQFFPDAKVFRDHRTMLKSCDADIVDVATLPEGRALIIEDALCDGRHVLSQKPFVTDLDRGLQLVELAQSQGLKLAVNQNARWAPHFSWAKHAVERGVIGDVFSVRFVVHWDYRQTPSSFRGSRDWILFEYGIHWFDLAQVLMGGGRAEQVFASTCRGNAPDGLPDMLAQAVITYPRGQAAIGLNGAARVGTDDYTVITGERGIIVSRGPDKNHQQVTLYLEDSVYSPDLEGNWNTLGFQGTLGELAVAIEEDRQYYHGARENLESLALCFAAVQSSLTGRSCEPWSVRHLPV
ncbi:MAG TPA: Gfo/Idh/MocA family oxidoreductase [Candidatus Hydrogenedentes bacterium]|nr:Gfo/Idh/MocA family oxidoreductase [Candidatus Hydrogenedentota bacterium]